MIISQFRHCVCEIYEWLHFGIFFKLPCIMQIYALYESPWRQPHQPYYPFSWLRSSPCLCASDLYNALAVGLNPFLISKNVARVRYTGVLRSHKFDADLISIAGCVRSTTRSTMSTSNCSPTGMLSSNSFMSILNSQLGYITGYFRALQLILLVVFGAMDQMLACMLVHLLEI